jgi:hypothetical protein
MSISISSFKVWNRLFARLQASSGSIVEENATCSSESIEASPMMISSVVQVYTNE